MILTILDVRS